MPRLGPRALVHPSAEVRDCRLGRYVEIDARCRLSDSSVGDYSYIMQDGEIAGSEIGRFTSVAAWVRVNASNHPSWRASQHHFSYRANDYFDGVGADEAFFAWRAAHPVRVGHDVWVGHGAILLPGVAVGHGAVIGAGAVVTGDVAPWTKVAGVPARPIGRRFEPAIGARLERLAWWDWPHERLREKLVHLSDIHIDRAPILGTDPVARFERVLAHVAEHHGDAERIVITGDLTHRGDAASYRTLGTLLAYAGLMDGETLDVRLRLLLGNHDVREAFAAAFPTVARDAAGFVQSVDETPVGRFVYLDTVHPGTHAGRLCPERLDWLDETLERARADGEAVYLFMHHNPVPVGVASADRIGLVEWRELGETLASFPGLVRHAFFGHCHFTLAGSFAGIPFSAPRSTCHPCWPDPGGDDPRLGVGPLEPSYAVALLEPDATVVHTIDFEREAEVRRIETAADGWIDEAEERGVPVGADGAGRTVGVARPEPVAPA